MLLAIRQLVCLPSAVAGMLLRLGLQRTAGLLVMLYRASDDGLANAINELTIDEKNRCR